MAPLLTLDSVVNLLQVYAQTSFILHVLQLQSGPNSLLTPRQVEILKSIFVYLTAFNLCNWLRVSIAVDEDQASDKCLATLYFSPHHWTYVEHIMLPILAFYSFQSFLTFILCIASV